MQNENFLARFAADESGATAIEYGLIVALIAIAAMSGMNAFAGATSGMWNNVRTEVDGVLGKF